MTHWCWFCARQNEFHQHEGINCPKLKIIDDFGQNNSELDLDEHQQHHGSIRDRLGPPANSRPSMESRLGPIF